jgi:hypothetical protein
MKLDCFDNYGKVKNDYGCEKAIVTVILPLNLGDYQLDFFTL